MSASRVPVKVIPKPKLFEAAVVPRFDRRQEMPAKFRSLLCNCDSGATGTWHVHRGSNGTLVREGDVIVMHPDGPHVYSDSAFRDAFVVVELP